MKSYWRYFWLGTGRRKRNGRDGVSEAGRNLTIIPRSAVTAERFDARCQAELLGLILLLSAGNHALGFARGPAMHSSHGAFSRMSAGDGWHIMPALRHAL